MAVCFDAHAILFNFFSPITIMFIWQVWHDNYLVLATTDHLWEECGIDQFKTRFTLLFV